MCKKWHLSSSDLELFFLSPAYPVFKLLDHIIQAIKLAGVLSHFLFLTTMADVIPFCLKAKKQLVAHFYLKCQAAVVYDGPSPEQGPLTVCLVALAFT